MEKVKEIIEVEQSVPDKYATDQNSKWVNFSYEDYDICLTIGGKGNFFEGIQLTVRHKQIEDAVEINVRPVNKELKISIDHPDGMTETKYMSRKEILALQNIEAALKIIGSALK